MSSLINAVRPNSSKTTTPHFLFYGNSSSCIGSGHIMRLYALAEECAQRGYKTTFIYKECTPANLAKLQRAKFLTLAIKTLDTTILKQSPTHLVIDDYDLSDQEWKIIEELPIFKLVFDDDINNNSLPVDLIINAAPNAQKERYQIRAPSATLCLGPRYVVLRKEFEDAQHAMPAFIYRKRILIMMGGTDVKGLSIILSHHLLAQQSTYPISLIIGQASIDDEQHLKQLKQTYYNFEYHINPPNVANIMKQAGLAISAAGSSLSELVCMGVPTIALVCANNQEKILTQEDYSTWYYPVDFRGFTNTQSKINNLNLLEQVCQLVAELYQNDTKRLAMHEYAKHVLDTKGTARILEKI